MTAVSSNCDHDASVERFGDPIAGRHDEIALPAAGNGDRAACDSVAHEAVADRCGTGERQCLIGPEITESVGVADHFDLVHWAFLDVVEHSAVGDHRFRGQLVASEDEIEAKMARQDWPCSHRAAKNHPDIASAFLDRSATAGT